MHRHRLATLLLGMWLSGLLLITYVATHNFQEAERLFAHPSPGAAKLMAPLSVGDAHLLLRHEAAEMNRLYFNTFELFEIAVGIVLSAVLLTTTTPAAGWRMLAPLLLVLSLLMHFLLTPGITRIGQGLDFIQPGLQTPERAEFWRLHQMYSGLVVGKLLIVLALTGRLLLQRSRRTHKAESGDQVDGVHHRHDREVNR